MTRKLFAILVGGHHPRANIELHDMRFCIGETLEATYRQLRDTWWGTPASLHIDGYVELSALDGHRIDISDEPAPAANAPKLFFVNVGYYDQAEFGEHHAYRFMIGRDKAEVWKRALRSVPNGESRHKDNFLDIDDIIEVTSDLFSHGKAHLKLVPDASAPVDPPVMISDYIRLPG
ncbi:DUF1543 domain-containing protein [Ponticaulis profundi]|uniref:DUF1543 domain-containing protein n=1 Tax=Ponticaulis profundi TaxID=2665222 RepID=A0ABW1S7R0_9PROT